MTSLAQSFKFVGLEQVGYGCSYQVQISSEPAWFPLDFRRVLFLVVLPSVFGFRSSRAVFLRLENSFLLAKKIGRDGCTVIRRGRGLRAMLCKY